LLLLLLLVAMLLRLYAGLLASMLLLSACTRVSDVRVCVFSSVADVAAVCIGGVVVSCVVAMHVIIGTSVATFVTCVYVGDRCCRCCCCFRFLIG